ncbi:MULTISPECIES: hypothetical protein [unclassified Blastococcus]
MTTTTPLPPPTRPAPAHVPIVAPIGGAAPAAPGRLRRLLPVVLLFAAQGAGAGAALAFGLGGSAFPLPPLTPRLAMEAAFAAAWEGDGAASWDVLCAQERREQGPRDEYLRSTARFAEVDVEDRLDYAVIGVQPTTSEGRHGFAVTVLFSDDGRPAFADTGFVVWEDDGFRACGVL